MKMILEKHGTDTSGSEVTSVGPHGFWLLINAKEYFVAFADYPQFKQATVEQIFHIKHIGLDQLYWPALDIDIELDALRHPENYSLIWQE
jgi:hypothetical protein